MDGAFRTYCSEDEISAALDPERAPAALEVVHEPLPSGAVQARLIIGGTRAERNRAALDAVLEFWRQHPHTPVLHDCDPGGWPFRPPSSEEEGWAAGDLLVLLVDEIDRAFPNLQTNSTRLTLTQSTYTMQRRLDRLAARKAALVVATADERAIAACADEALSRRGPWSRTMVVRVRGREAGTPAEDPPPAPPLPTAEASAQEWLRFGFHTPSPLARLNACRRAADLDQRSPVAHLALGSACMEHEDFDGARAALDRAAALAPGWEAVYYERGKFWLRYDDMEQAAANFGRACGLMPSFAASFSNLGAALGELDRPEEAVAAFRQALTHDPYGFQVLSNFGVVCREMGQLAESERSFRRAIELAPEFVFGHYNLGHTLFLQGRFAEAVVAYAEGQRRDPQRNPRQASRLALARLAAGDPDGARRDFDDCLARVDPNTREDLLREAQEIVSALIGHDGNLAAGQEFTERIARELAQTPS